MAVRDTELRSRLSKNINLPQQQQQQVYLAHQKVIFTKISDVKIKKEGRQPFRNSRANRA